MSDTALKFGLVQRVVLQLLYPRLIGDGSRICSSGFRSQATVEAGTSDLVKEMLSKMDVTDCALGIAPDMFEIGHTWGA